MKQRCPHSAGGAFCRVKDILTAKVCAEFLGVTTWTIYDRCDAATPGELNISFAQAQELDAMCLEKKGETPLLDYFAREMRSINGEKQGPDTDLARSVMAMNASGGALSKAVMEALDATTNPSDLSENQRINILRHLEACRRLLVDLENSLSPRKVAA